MVSPVRIPGANPHFFIQLHRGSNRFCLMNCTLRSFAYLSIRVPCNAVGGTVVEATGVGGNEVGAG